MFSVDHYYGPGNDILHSLTSGKRQRLRVDLGDFEDNTVYAEYDDFAVGPASTEYELTSLGNYSGDAGQCIFVFVTINIVVSDLKEGSPNRLYLRWNSLLDSVVPAFTK